MLRAPYRKSSTPRKVRAPQPSEAQIQQTCSEWLALDGWRRVRMDMKQLRGMGVQEPGMADDLYIRYPSREMLEIEMALGSGFHAQAEVIWIEWKRVKGKRSTEAALDQWGWHVRERTRCALTWIAGVDFPATIEGFQEHYRKSGLMRKSLR